jgi:predicted XRE-type DNA-binding protein
MRYKNAFSAFGLDPDVATIDTLRTDIAIALTRYIEVTGISQEKAGELFGVKQSVVSQIVRGDIAHLSVERLIRAMVRAKIQGFAEWGESSEDARAGTGYSPAALSTPVYIAGSLDLDFSNRWTGDASNASKRNTLIEPKGPIRRRSNG